MPDETMTPTRQGFSLDMSRPASLIASRAAMMPYWQNGSMWRCSFGGMCASMSSPRISPAKRVWKRDASKRVMGAMPPTPATAFFQKAGTSLPMGVRAPRPVMTIFRDMVVPG